METVHSSEKRASGRGVSRWFGIAIAGCLGIVIGAIASRFVMDKAYRENEQALQRMLADSQAKTDELQQLLGSPLLIPIEGQGTQKQASGRIYWDRKRNDWHVYVFDLKPLAPGRMFELWFITPDGKKIPSETFALDRDGRGQMVAKVPQDIGPITTATITDEPRRMDQPTGQIHLTAKVPEGGETTGRKTIHP